MKKILRVILSLILKSFNIKKLAKDIVEDILEPALLDAAKESSNKLDDAAVATIYPVLKDKLFLTIDSKLDIDKILKK